MRILPLPSRTPQYISFSELGEKLEEALCEESGHISFSELGVKLKEILCEESRPIISRDSSELGKNLKEALCEEDQPICDFSEYTEINTEVVCYKQQIEYFTESLPAPLNEQEALAEVDTEKGQETEDGEQETIYRAIPLLVISDEQGVQQQYCSSTETLLALFPKAPQVLATFGMEKGKKGERCEPKRKDSAISLRFLSDKQKVKQRYCSSTGTFMPVPDWRQTVDSDDARFKAKYQKAEQAFATFDIEKGKKGERFDIPLLSDTQVVERQYCSSTDTYMPITDWRQTFDPEDKISNAERQKVEQTLANLEKAFKLLA